MKNISKIFNLVDIHDGVLGHISILIMATIQQSS